METKQLLSLAYGYLGSLVEGEDIVQEALLRFEQSDKQSIRNVEAWLEPEQRVVFVLREVFKHSYQSIAEIAGKSEVACRQLMVRARSALDRAREVPPPASTITASIVNRFIDALGNGDEKELLGIIAHDAVLVGDGGGKVPSILNPVYGADRIVRFFLGVIRKEGNVFEDIRPATVNSGPGMLTFRDGQLVSVVSVSIEGARITAIYSVNNPDKIRVRAPMQWPN